MGQRSKVARSATGKTGRPIAAVAVTPVRTRVVRGKRATMVWQWAVILASNGETSAPEVHDNKGSARGAVIGFINQLLENGHDVDARWEDQTGHTQQVVYSVNEEGSAIIVSRKDIPGRVDEDGNPLPGPRCIDLPWSAKSGQPGNTSLVRRRKAVSGAPPAEREEREAERAAKRKREPKGKDPKAKTPKTPKTPKEPKEPKVPKTPKTPKGPKTERAPRTPKTPEVVAPPPPPPPPPPPAPPRKREERAPRTEKTPRTPRTPRTPKVEAPSEAAEISDIQNSFINMLQSLGPKPAGASHTGRPNPYRIGGR